MAESESESRRYLRFPPDEWEIALIQCSDAPTDEANFEPVIAGLVMEESHAGCGLVVLDRQIKDKLKAGDRCLVKVARLGIVLAEVRWLNELEGGISRLGLHYID
jgi:hypothetical protein